jgi:hypothetical protein
VDSGVLDDVYLTVDSLPSGRRGPVGIGVTVQPLVSWLWVGGGVVVVGAVLAALPGRRRRPTDAASALPDVRRRGRLRSTTTSGRARPGRDGHEAAIDEQARPAEEPAVPIGR